MSFDVLLTRAAVVTLAAVACWTLVLLGCVLVEAGSAGRLRPARLIGCPERWRVVLVGAALVILGAAMPTARAGSVQAPPAPVLDGLPLPDRVVGPGPSQSRPRVPSHDQAQGPTRRRPRGPSPERYRVRAGDSLWRIARARLGPRASTPDVAAYVAAIHHANRAGIGTDPDLIHVGLELRLPSPPPRTR